MLFFNYNRWQGLDESGEFALLWFDQRKSGMAGSGPELVLKLLPHYDSILAAKLGTWLVKCWMRRAEKD